MSNLADLFTGQMPDIRRAYKDGGVKAALDVASAGTIYAKVETAILRARLYLATPDDPRHEEANAIIECATKLKALVAQDLAILGTLEKLTTLCAAADAKITAPLIKKGVAFRDGPKKPRVDALGRLIIDALNELGAKAPAKDVLRHVEKHGTGVIDEIDGETIYWRRPNGKDEATTFKTFDNRVSGYRKKIED